MPKGWRRKMCLLRGVVRVLMYITRTCKETTYNLFKTSTYICFEQKHFKPTEYYIKPVVRGFSGHFCETFRRICWKVFGPRQVFSLLQVETCKTTNNSKPDDPC